MNKFLYPNQFKENFSKNIFNKFEFNINKYQQENIPKNIDIECKKNDIFKILPHQLFLRNYLSHRTPYDSLLVFHGTGTGKTLTSISIAEGLRKHPLFLRKRILVLVPASLVENYKQELKLYFRNMYKNLNITKINLQLKTFYEIISYQKFANYVKKLSNDQIIDYFDKRTIIVDEVHNIKDAKIEDNFNTFDALMKVLTLSTFNKLILLSATPMYDNVNELKNLLKLLLQNEKKDITFIDKLNLNDHNKIKQILSGYISYVRTEHPASFAKRIYNGKIIKPILQNTTVIDVNMSNYQFNNYIKLLNRENINDDNQQKYRMYSNILPDDINSNKLNIDELLDENDSISRKLGTLIQNILDNDTQKHFIFSEFKNNGAKLIFKALQQNGIRNIYLVTGDDSAVKKNEIIKKFNNIKRGILIGTAVLKEGVSLKNVQNVHIFEPWFNRSKIDQIIGRALRYCSHKDLPENERYVNIYQYVSMYPNISYKDINNFEKYNDIKNLISYDIYALHIAEKKDIEIKKLERIFKEISIDCLLNYQYNNLVGKENSRECDYTTCKYYCNNNKNSSNEIDMSTLHFSFIQPYMDILSNEIIEFISNNYIMNLQQLYILMENLYKKYNDINFKNEFSRRYIIQHTLINIVPNPSIDFTNFPYIVTIKRSGQQGYIIIRGQFILFQPFDDNKLYKLSNNENKTIEERIIGKQLQENNYTLSRYLNQFKKEKVKELKLTNIQMTEQNVNLSNYGKYIGIVIKTPFTLKLLTLESEMNIKNFKGTKYNTLKRIILDDYFENLLKIYKKNNQEDSKNLQDEYEEKIKKKDKGKILYKLLLKMDEQKIDNKRWIYNQSKENLTLNDFK
jgi:superfamily II DNA or RNA helicase